jgi:hypothetical protein
VRLRRKIWSSPVAWNPCERNSLLAVSRSRVRVFRVLVDRFVIFSLEVCVA